jgi:F-type H+-transporting ATPase subunit gamma
MAAQLRVYRRRIRSVHATKKITRAMELIATSRIVKAQQRVHSAGPYAAAITRAVAAVASGSTTVDHPLVTTSPRAARAAVILVTSDRGLAGSYSSAAIKEGEQLAGSLRSQGKDVASFLVGRKAIGYYRFRDRPVAGQWSGFSENPTYADAKAVAGEVIEAFMALAADGGVDEIHVVYTEFVSMMTQKPRARQILPLEPDSSDERAPDGPHALYEFEPSAAGVLDALLPRYVESQIFSALLQAAASEHAARRRAMKSATDNAEDLIKVLTRRANAARQAEITQEISEIVGGADALASATAGSE